MDKTSQTLNIYHELVDPSLKREKSDAPQLIGKYQQIRYMYSRIGLLL